MFTQLEPAELAAVTGGGSFNWQGLLQTALQGFLGGMGGAGTQQAQQPQQGGGGGATAGAADASSGVAAAGAANPLMGGLQGAGQSIMSALPSLLGGLIK